MNDNTLLLYIHSTPALLEDVYKWGYDRMFEISHIIKDFFYIKPYVTIIFHYYYFANITALSSFFND